MCTVLLEYETNDRLKSLYRDYQSYRTRAEETGNRWTVHYWADKVTEIEKEAASRGLDLNS